MENYGCVTWGDALIFRSEPSHQEREERALILLHEMAHMWFGDMVTMKWWEDLWLNEAFAEWACYWAATAATQFTDVWSSFLAGGKLYGYRADMAPTTHPIRQPVRDVAEAAASFDGITYPKGAAVLKQLVSYVGEDEFVAGLRSYFAHNAWGNTSLDDLMSEIASASGRDLGEWTKLWLDTAGTDRLVLERDGDGALQLLATSPDGGSPRPHRLDIGIYDRSGESLVRRQLVPVEVSGSATPIDDVASADLLLVNDEDLTFASTRPDSESLATMLSSSGALPTAVSRAVAVTTAWDMLMTADIRTADFVGCVTAALQRESVDALVEPFLDLASRAAERWSPAGQRDGLLGVVADTCLLLAEQPARRQVAMRTLARTAVTDEQLAALLAAPDRDFDIRWRTAIRLAELGRADKAEVESLSSEDPDPDAWVRALAADTAVADPAAKEAAWTAIVDEHKVPMGSIGEMVTAFWRPAQDDILAPYAQRFLETLPKLSSSGMIPALVLSQGMFPVEAVGADFIEQVKVVAADPEVIPIVRNRVLEQADVLRRMLAARSA
jgi:aminopeptidase N